MRTYTARDAAHTYIKCGLSVVPIIADAKKPRIRWKSLQTRILTAWEVDRYFYAGDSIAIVCGGVSGNLVCVDFDDHASLWTAMRDLVSDLMDKCITQSTKSGGKHLICRVESGLYKNEKLAIRSGEQEQHVQIETRGEGGYFLAYPSVGYQLESGSFQRIPVLREEEYQSILAAARTLNTAHTRPYTRHAEINRNRHATIAEIEPLREDEGWIPSTGISLSIDLDSGRIL